MHIQTSIHLRESNESQRKVDKICTERQTEGHTEGKYRRVTGTDRPQKNE